MKHVQKGEAKCWLLPPVLTPSVRLMINLPYPSSGRNHNSHSFRVLKVVQDYIINSIPSFPTYGTVLACLMSGVGASFYILRK